MRTQVAFRQMDTSPALRDYATEKLERIVEKYVSGTIDASVVMRVQKYWHIADFTLNIKNLTVKGQERSEDMYASIDLALAKIEKQLRRHKDRLRDHKPTHGESRSFRMGVIAPLDGQGGEYAEEFAEEVSAYPKSDEESLPIDSKVAVLRRKVINARALSLEEAIIQLDLLEDREFYVFTDGESGNINVVYKRRDGNVGLIET